MKKIIILMALLTITSYAYATTINIPDDYSTIQAGIGAASDYDTVLVDTGTYVENINFNGKNVIVASNYLITQDTSYISHTIIDGNGGDHVVIFENDEGVQAILSGFTIQNGNANASHPNNCGGGVFLYEAKATIKNLIIKNNKADWGGGIYGKGGLSNTEWQNIKIKNNEAVAGGGIYFVDHFDPTIKNLIVKDNTTDAGAGGIYLSEAANLIIEKGIIFNNESVGQGDGGGFYSSGSTPQLINCTIYGNNAGSGEGDAIYWYDGLIILLNTIVWNNDIESYGSNYIVDADFCDIEQSYGFSGNGNIDSNPLFVDPDNGDFHLTENSPCIDAGDPTFPLDPDGTIADIGRYYYDQGQNSVNDEPEQITQKSFVSYPNPITNLTNDINISFALKKPSKINIRLYNIKGQMVIQILNDNKPNGTHTISSNINNLATGIYFIKMDVDGKNRAVKKMVKIE